MTTTQPSQAVAKRSLDTALMPPPPPPKRIKRPTTVLEEDEYTRGLSHIIARDFFPGLLETEAQEEYLDALESKDREWINDAGMRMREAMTPRRDGQKGRRGTSMTPSTDRGATFRTPRNWEGDTPVSVAGTDASREEDQKPKVDLSLSLTAFQAKYTSEDNESFNTSLDKQNTKRAEKYSWLYNGNQIPTARQIAWRNRDAKLLEDTRRERTNHDRENRNMHAIDDHPSASSATALTTRASRPAMPLHRPSAPRNGLMFIPADLPSSIPSRAETAAAASNAPPKSVSHASTRFAAPVDPNQETVPPSPSLSAIDDAIRGRPRDATDSEAGYSGAETPRVAGWAFVDAEPTEAELREEEGGLELLRKLHGGEKEEGKNPFTIHTTSKREDLHHRIVEKQNAQKRSAGMGGRLAEVLGGKTPGGLMPGATPRFASAAGVKGRAQGALTPAGERLLRTVGTPKREGLFGGERKKGETSNAWTPTPRVRKKAAG
ncbi:hypothetical protein EV356DRAFT_450872 [Viridothelium virens]|uniref:Nuclear protein DGCR14 n=1 Tax=Viridothelium virens TaxID=1048519 RepID=A0A6A6H2L4_VIRVR|nr:hypothetical protein EV356DRAFT_450872 [Viridothelium virens]